MSTNDTIIYLDNAATTKVNQAILDKYNQINISNYANSSSIHFFGVASDRLLESAKQDIISSLKLKNQKVIFTSGATEANNLAIKGIAFKYKNRGKHIIVSNIEHPSVLEVVKQLENEFGYRVTYLPVDENGKVSISLLKENMTSETILVSIMAVNNEIGSINPIDEIIKIVKEFPKAYLHVDATQAVGKVILNYSEIDAFTYSSHKIHGLKNSGALVIKNNISLFPLLNGGGQQDGYRSGTVDIASAICNAEAVKLAIKGYQSNLEYVTLLNNKVKDYLLNNKDLYVINSPSDGSKYILNFSTLNKKASVIVEALSNNNIMVSSISACHSKREKSSYVVERINHKDYANNTIRVSFDVSNTLEEIDIFIKTLDQIVKGIK